MMSIMESYCYDRVQYRLFGFGIGSFSVFVRNIIHNSCILFVMNEMSCKYKLKIRILQERYAFWAYL